MKPIHTIALIVSALGVFCGSYAWSAAPEKPLVSVDKNGKISYDANDRGDRVPDFSTCGFAGGDRPIPNVQVVVVVPCRAGDSTARIQKAIDYASALRPDTNGLRGAVLLLAGRHEVSGGLVITNSGVVLRGEGIGEKGATLVASGLDRRTLIRIVGRNDWANSSGAKWELQDARIPVGATSLRVANANGLVPGTPVRIVRPSTQTWIDQLGADEFGGGIGGGWKRGSRDIAWERIVKSVEGDLVNLDAPITTAIEKGPAGEARLAMVRGEWPGRIHQVGVENLSLESTFDASNASDENHSWCAITIESASDCWVRQMAFKHFAGSAVAIFETGSRVTVQDCLSLEPISQIGGYRRHTFFTMGQQTLFLRCYSEHGRHDYSVGHCAAGPNAFVQCEAHAAVDDSGPIESWASGVLYDNVVIDGNALTLGFRAGNNAAIGWAAANCVLWNCSASIIGCWNPPGAQNWSFGSWAGFQGDGVWRSSNDFMPTDSLFAGQLRDRLGSASAERLQLMPRPHDESSNPPLDKAQELAAASHGPAPTLREYIVAAIKRDPIPHEPGTTKKVDELAFDSTPLKVPARKLVVTNGWLTINGKLVVGGSSDVAWWRGNIRPQEAPSFGLGVTRFVPGRVGAGFTDDLNELADALVTRGDAALDYHYGLWHERRRDDHERVRRMNGDVLPPFYELPFARSGQGTAWDGLSKYDLTKFNPWYWSRLRQFAGVCEQRGLILFHQNYFQHNILEAGAHWADCPWRSANNINETGFPEPPPYAGDKRIFMAELFYDTTHPVRRELHRHYIRQCLDNFTNNANVIQFTSAEFTGPRGFVEFWLDTIAEWEREKVAQTSKSAVSRVSKPAPVSHDVASADLEVGDTAGLETCATHPLVALSCTKDVQDAILADAKRSGTVDVIDFRYWWRTDKGEFAPPGGKNLAPRQFERQWRGGRPTDANAAGMAAEYSARFPAKPLICDFDTAGWAWVCAGGSLPRLPRTTDAALLEAIPHMRPSATASKNGQWILSEPGKQLFICGGGNTEVDLSAESGSFRVSVVDPRTGQLTSRENVKGGGKVQLPTGQVIWLRKE